MSMQVNADLSGIDGFAGSVDGILNAVQSPAFQGDFIDYIMGELKEKFIVDSIAAKNSGTHNLQHVFEWPRTDGQGFATERSSNIPLFTLLQKGSGDTQYMTYEFIPSTRLVPLPDPERYGIDPAKLQTLSRHKFRFKAIVMETQGAVTIEPNGENRLFIPDAKSEGGYYMTKNPQTINPGGEKSTGAFSQWWTTWFETRAQVYVSEQVKLSEEMIKSTGQKIIRDATTGRFARGKSVSIGYADAARTKAEAKMLSAAERYYSNGDFE